MQEFKGSLYKSMEDPQIDLTNVKFLIYIFHIFLGNIIQLTTWSNDTITMIPWSIQSAVYAVILTFLEVPRLDISIEWQSLKVHLDNNYLL